jgi:hypothetical protein
MFFTKFLKWAGTGLLLVCVLFLMVSVTGCTSLSDKTADEIAPLIDKYCDEIITGVREDLRARINEKSNGHQIKVTCKNDNLSIP